MARREDLFGIAEKMPKLPKSTLKIPKAVAGAGAARRPIVALEGRDSAQAALRFSAISQIPGMDKSVPWWFIAPC